MNSRLTSMLQAQIAALEQERDAAIAAAVAENEAAVVAPKLQELSVQMSDKLAALNAERSKKEAEIRADYARQSDDFANSQKTAVSLKVGAEYDVAIKKIKTIYEGN